MSDDNQMSRLTKIAQQNMFRYAERDHGLSRKVIHLDSGIPMTTLKNWATDTEMPISGINRLAGIIPDYLLSLLTEPGKRAISTAEEGDGDLDALACESSAFVHDYVESKLDGKITPIEKARLNEHKRRIRGLAA